jgi:hypothetical protein
MSDPLEEQCVRMYRIVYGNIEQSLDDARRAFQQQDKSIIEGWKRLARSVSTVTSAQTLEYISKR